MMWLLERMWAKLTSRAGTDEDVDRNWREMMTHWNEAEKTLVYGPTPATLSETEENT